MRFVKNRLPIKLGLLLVAFLFLFTLQAEPLKIKITSPKGSLRANPAKTAALVGVVRGGEIYEVLEKTGVWYKIVSEQTDGRKVTGYVHQSLLVELNAPTTTMAATTQEKAKPKPPAPVTEAKAVKKQTAPAKPAPAAKPTPLVKKNTPSGDKEEGKLFVRIAGGYASKSTSVNTNLPFTAYFEESSVASSYDVKGSGPTGELAVGYWFSKSLGAEVAFSYVSGSNDASFTAAVPHPLYFNKTRSASWKKDLSYSEMELDLNLLYRMAINEKMTLVFTLGGAYFPSVSLENLSSLDWTDSYPYTEVTVTPSYDKQTGSGFGVNAGASIDYALGKKMFLTLGARYSTASVTVDSEFFDSTVGIDLKPGGIRGLVGIKFLF